MTVVWCGVHRGGEGVGTERGEGREGERERGGGREREREGVLVGKVEATVDSSSSSSSSGSSGE